MGQAASDGTGIFHGPSSFQGTTSARLLRHTLADQSACVSLKVAAGARYSGARKESVIIRLPCPVRGRVPSVAVAMAMSAPNHHRRGESNFNPLLALELQPRPAPPKPVLAQTDTLA